MLSNKIPKYPFSNPYKHNIVWTPLGFRDMDVVGHYIINNELKLFKIMLWEQFNGGVHCLVF